MGHADALADAHCHLWWKTQPLLPPSFSLRSCPPAPLWRTKLQDILPRIKPWCKYSAGWGGGGQRGQLAWTYSHFMLWGDWVTVPPKLRKPILEVLHVGHPGIVRMKVLARSYIWWPNMDRDIAKWVATCNQYQESRPAPHSAPAHKWETSRALWSRVHILFLHSCPFSNNPIFYGQYCLQEN